MILHSAWGRERRPGPAFYHSIVKTAAFWVFKMTGTTDPSIRLVFVPGS